MTAINFLGPGFLLPVVSKRPCPAALNTTTGAYSHALPDDEEGAADVWEQRAGCAACLTLERALNDIRGAAKMQPAVNRRWSP